MKHIITTVIVFAGLFSGLASAQRSSQTYRMPGYTEATAKFYLDNTYYLDPIEGIWQSTDGFVYSIERERRENGRFLMIVLKSSSNQWSPTEIKAYISYGSTRGLYSMDYYTKSANGSAYSSVLFLALENPMVLTFSRIDNGEEIALLRTYPQMDASGTYGVPSAWTGTGFVIGGKYIATNNHVVEDAQSLEVFGIKGDINNHMSAKVVAVDKDIDLAIIKITDPKFMGVGPLNYGFKTTTKEVGSGVFVLGYPLTSSMGEEVKLTTGVISATSGFQGDVSQYQISAPVQPGNSGGPLFDNQGNIVGVVSAKHTGAENVGYAIKLDYLRKLMAKCGEPVSFAGNNAISGLSLPEKVKAVKSNVLLIKANWSQEGAAKKYISANVSNRYENYSVDALYKRGTEDLKQGKENDGIAELLSAIEQNHDQSLVSLTQHHIIRHRQGVPIDLITDMDWLVKKAQQGVPLGQFCMGLYLELALGEYAEAISWYEKAGVQGVGEAYYTIGRFYAEGLGVSANLVTAFEYWMKGAKLGDPLSALWVANVYDEGIPGPLGLMLVPQDENEAFKWYRRGAEMGEECSMRHLAIYYWEGKGCEQDRSAAKKWMQRAVDNGDETAKELIKKMQ